MSIKITAILIIFLFSFGVNAVPKRACYRSKYYSTTIKEVDHKITSFIIAQTLCLNPVPMYGCEEPKPGFENTLVIAGVKGFNSYQEDGQWYLECNIESDCCYCEIE